MSPLPRVARLFGALLCALVAPAGSHDLITVESAQRYLAQADQHVEALGSQQAAAKRAEASNALGRMLDEIRDLLNRDLAAHGRVQGLPTSHLVHELDQRGLALRIDPRLGRFPANLGYYRESLRLAPDGAHAGEASFRLLQGYFYDSFRDDPLQPREQSWTQLEGQIRLGERFLDRNPTHPEREEAEFIVLTHYMQAARSAPDASSRSGYARRSALAGKAFVSRYPDSMRAAAVPVLLEQLAR